MTLIDRLPSAAEVPPVARPELAALAAVLLLALAARLAALLVLDVPLYSDAAAYMEMARTAIVGPAIRDIYGNAALYSPGYPLLLSALFRLFGIAPEVARVANLALGVVAVLLTWALGRRATGSPAVGLIAAFGAALLIPAIASTEMLERENLSVPLLLLFLWLTLGLVRSAHPLRLAALTGAVFGCGLLAGVSTLFTGAAFVAAVALRRPSWWQGSRALLVFAGGTAMVLAPWVAHVNREVGRPMLSTNGGINLYVGNNPAATGRFVSIADTPMGPRWQAFRAAHGEAEQSAILQRLAIAHVAAHPARTLALDLRKLVYFWLPDTPDPTDSNLGGAVTAVRWAGAFQHGLILMLAAGAVFGWRRWSQGVCLIALAIVAFWSIHGIVYVITRYRAPAMPPLLVLAAIPLADRLVRRRRVTGAPLAI